LYVFAIGIFYIISISAKGRWILDGPR
jgi:hypothetical protein